MSFDDSVWLEAVRLLHKFFPESRGLIHGPRDLQIDSLFQMLKRAEPSLQRIDRDPSLEGSSLCRWILKRAKITPAGRAVVVPDCGCPDYLPFICDEKRLLERADEPVPQSKVLRRKNFMSEILFHSGSDTFIVFESGEAILADHEDGVCWARTQIEVN